MKKVIIIHTSMVLHDTLKNLFHEIIPEAEVRNIMDDTLLAEVSQNGKITPAIVRRLGKYIEEAELLGADLIFSSCSSMGGAIDIVKNLVNAPILKIDQEMADTAVNIGNKIAVIATVKSTVEPSCNLVKNAGEALGKNVEVVPVLVDGALDILMSGDRKKHNMLVHKAVLEAEKTCDVIVLAQGSMTVLLPELTDIKKPVLTSPRMGVERARKILFGE